MRDRVYAGPAGGNLSRRVSRGRRIAARTIRCPRSPARTRCSHGSRRIAGRGAAGQAGVQVPPLYSGRAGAELQRPFDAAIAR
jgi:hypothetical protein